MSSAEQLERTVFQGRFVQSLSLKELEICDQGLIGVDEQGKIAIVERDATDTHSVLKEHGWEDAKIVRITGNSFLFPGFVDTHIHVRKLRAFNVNHC